MTRHSPSVIVLLAAITAFLVGSNSSEGDNGPATDDAQSKSSDQKPGSPTGASGGVLTGRALFEGKVPPPRKLVVDKDVDHCESAGGEVQEIVVAKDKALADVVVEIKGIKQKGEWDWKHPKDGYVIRQRGCLFKPHFLVVPDKAELTIYNHDTMLHNVNTAQWNIAQPGGEDYVSKKKIAYQGRPFVRINCNVHSWMEAWVYIARSPYYAVTGADGKFKIENVPPGSYKVTARHPKLRVQRFKITVEDGKTVKQEVTFKPKK